MHYLFIYSAFIEHLNCARHTESIQEQDMKLPLQRNENFLLPFSVPRICLACNRCSANFLCHSALNWLVKSLLASADPAKKCRVAVVLPQIMRTFVLPQFTSCSRSIKNKCTLKISSQLDVFRGAGVDSQEKNHTQKLISSLKSDL